jgi:hypothetical protein
VRTAINFGAKLRAYIRPSQLRTLASALRERDTIHHWQLKGNPDLFSMGRPGRSWDACGESMLIHRLLLVSVPALYSADSHLKSMYGYRTDVEKREG